MACSLRRRGGHEGWYGRVRPPVRVVKLYGLLRSIPFIRHLVGRGPTLVALVPPPGRSGARVVLLHPDELWGDDHVRVDVPKFNELLALNVPAPGDASGCDSLGIGRVARSLSPVEHLQLLASARHADVRPVTFALAAVIGLGAFAALRWIR